MVKVVKRILALALVAVWLVPVSSGTAAAKETLDVWFYPADDPGTWKQIVSIWNEEYPDVEIVGQIVPWEGHVEKYTTAIVSGTLPDVGYTYPSLATGWVLEADVLEPLDSYLGGNLTKDNLAGTSAYIHDGALYAMPLVGDAKGPIWYNTDLFDRAGIPGIPADRSISHEEWLEVSSKLVQDTNGDGESDTYAYAWPGTPDASTADWVFPVFWSAGASIIGDDGSFGLNTPAGVEALKYLAEYASNYSPPGTVAMKSSDISQLFLNHKTAMQMNNTGHVQELEEIDGLHWDIGVAPHWKTDITNYTVFDALTLFNTSKKKDLAWEWIQFVMSEPIQGILVRSLGIPSARLDIGTDPLKASFDPKGDLYLRVLDVASKHLASGRSHDPHPAIAKLWEISLNEIGAARLGQKTPERALQDAERAAERVLRRY